MTEFERQFSINYYQWAKREILREIEGGFPMLSRLRCSFSLRCYEFLVGLPAAQQRTSAVARVKQGNPEASRLCGEPITKQEEKVLEHYGHRKAIEYPVVGRVTYRGPSMAEQAIMKAIHSKELRPQRSTESFRTAVLARVREVLGGNPEVDQFGTIKHVAKGSNYKITTLITLRGKFPLRYTHHLTAPDGLSKETSFLKWMGIAGDTFWDLLTVEVAEEAIEQLVGLCSGFIAEAPQLLPTPLK